MKRLSIEHAREVGKKRGFKCLSDEYINSKSYLNWKCKKCGEIFPAILNNIKNESGCPYCRGLKVGKSNSLRVKYPKVAKEWHPGKNHTLTPDDVTPGSNKNVWWLCSNFNTHEWLAPIYSRTTGGNGCPYCSENKINFEEAKEIGKRAKLKLLSNKKNKTMDFKWECINCGYRFRKPFYKVKNELRLKKNSCLKCSGKIKYTKKYMIGDVKKIVSARGGKLLSKSYKNNQDKLKIRCKCENVFMMKLNDMLNRRWCPDCSSSFGERVCRYIFEKIFKEKFERNFFEWLRNEHGHKMQLDGYNDSLKIAFEYQGRQHYENVKHFHKNVRSYKQRILDDKKKEAICQKNKIRLIIIPEMPKYLKYENAISYIERKLKDKRILISSLKYKFKKDWLNDIYKNAPTKKARFNDLIFYVEEIKKGEVLEKVYKGILAKHKIQCAYGHIWDGVPSSILNNGTWCPKCGGKTKGTIEGMRTIANNRGGECLSGKYINCETKLKWKCKEGHIWEATPASVKSGRWCKKCAIKRRVEARGAEDVVG